MTRIKTMKRILVATYLVGMTVAFSAYTTPAAQSRDAYPVRTPDNKATPYGYSRSGGYAIPNSDRSRQAIPRRNGEACPYGYNPSGSSCLSVR